jgi:deoxyribonuclease-4
VVALPFSFWVSGDLGAGGVGMPWFGSHLSIAGGYYKAADEAARLGFDAVQIFTKNNNRWDGKPLTEADVSAFVESVARAKLQATISHDSYLINLGSPDDALWKRSIEAMAVEIERADRLGIKYVVAHPGSHVGSGEAAGLERIAAGLDQALAKTRSLTTGVALETTAGQGTNLGYRFEHLGEIIKQCRHADRLTACLDTCHVFAAGYELAPKKKYMATMKAFDAAVGIDRLVAFHINDSKKGLGSRVDRHEHLGKGCLGLEPFELLVNDRRFRHHPMYLETAKEVDPSTGRDWDAINLEVLQGLLQ